MQKGGTGKIMFANVNCAGLLGIEGYPVEVEAYATNGLPGFSLFGDLSSETKEAQYRVWNALKSCGYNPEPQKITMNLSPSDIRKEGTFYDLPVAVAVLGALSVIDTEKLRHMAFFGELGLDGEIKPVKGILPLCFCMRNFGIDSVLVPKENAKEASLVTGITVLGCRTLSEVINIALGSKDEIERCIYKNDGGNESGKKEHKYDVDFSDVRGQDYLKRAAVIAVCGRHNILFSGPAGTGKTMIARRMPTIMPDLTRDEDIEISKIYSICGLLNEGRPLLSERPFRAPHHGISQAAFAGGGQNVLPGEMSLASSGILFLDELPLFPRSVLETMRQPMEERKITVTRVRGSFTYPADFQLVSAMNNCACGFWPDRNRCTCSPAQIKAYNGRLSRPLMERIDICAEARPVSFDEFVDPDPKSTRETSAEIKARVKKVHLIQEERFRDDKNILFNSGMGVREIEKYCALGKAEEAYIKEIYARRGLSGRTYHKVLKVARTIADMAGCMNIEREHIAEAVELRSIEDKLFSKNEGAYHVI